MKSCFYGFALLFTIILSSCGSNESPFYKSKDDMQKQVDKIEKQFTSNVMYKQVTMMFEPNVGNIIAVMVKQQPESKMIENWSYVNTPISGGRRGVRLKLGSFGSWNKANEEFEKDNSFRDFSLKEIPWGEIPKWVSMAAADMIKKGVAEPEMQLLTFMNNGNGLVALISLQTQGGGSSVRYEFNMEGKLARAPY